MLDVQNIMVFFENALALNDFSMKVEEGEIVGVTAKLKATRLCCLEAPASAQVSPCQYSLLVSAWRSRARYSSGVKYGLVCG